MPFVKGFLGRWHPGSKPDIGLPGGDETPPWGIEEGELGPGKPKPPWAEWRPPEGWERPEFPELPPREEWPPLPPWFEEHPGNPFPLPIPPRPGAPTVPLPPDPEIDELPEIWPPLPGGPGFPGLPDLGGKTLALVVIHVSRHVHYVRWMVIDHETLKGKIKKAIDWLKAHMPAGGVGGRPPQTRPPGS